MLADANIRTLVNIYPACFILTREIKKFHHTISMSIPGYLSNSGSLADLILRRFSELARVLISSIRNTFMFRRLGANLPDMWLRAILDFPGLQELRSNLEVVLHLRKKSVLRSDFFIFFSAQSQSWQREGLRHSMETSTKVMTENVKWCRCMKLKSGSTIFMCGNFRTTGLLNGFYDTKFSESRSI